MPDRKEVRAQARMKVKEEREKRAAERAKKLEAERVERSLRYEEAQKLLKESSLKRKAVEADLTTVPKVQCRLPPSYRGSPPRVIIVAKPEKSSAASTKTIQVPVVLQSSGQSTTAQHFVLKAVDMLPGTVSIAQAPGNSGETTFVLSPTVPAAADGGRVVSAPLSSLGVIAENINTTKKKAVKYSTIRYSTTTKYSSILPRTVVSTSPSNSVVTVTTLPADADAATSALMEVPAPSNTVTLCDDGAIESKNDDDPTSGINLLADCTAQGERTIVMPQAVTKPQFSTVSISGTGDDTVISIEEKAD